MSEPRHRCPHCGAQARPTRYCEYCGGVLEAPPRGEDPGQPEDASRGSQERFRALLAHPQAKSTIERFTARPRRRRSRFGPLLMLVLFLALMVKATGGGPLEDVPSPVLLGFGLIVVLILTRGFRRPSAKRERAVPVRVVSERIQVRTGEGDPDESLHFVTLEYEDGRREEVEGVPPLVSSIVVEDMGVALLAGPRLLDFQRVPV